MSHDDNGPSLVTVRSDDLSMAVNAFTDMIQTESPTRTYFSAWVDARDRLYDACAKASS